MIDHKTNDKIITLTPSDAAADAAISQDALAHLGGGRIAYVRAISSDDALKMFPQMSGITPGLALFTLNAADGTPIMLTDSREAAVAGAWNQDLETVSVH